MTSLQISFALTNLFWLAAFLILLRKYYKLKDKQKNFTILSALATMGLSIGLSSILNKHYKADTPPPFTGTKTKND